MNVTLEGYDELRNALAWLGEETIPVVVKAWRKDAKKFIRPQLRKRVIRDFHGRTRLARSYAITVKGKKSAKNATMEFYSRVPAAVAHEYGMTIHARRRQYLAIPTAFVGIRMRNGKRKPRYFKNTFIKRSRNGKLIMFQRVTGGDRLISSYGIRAHGGGKFFEDEIVPLFILKRSVTLHKRTHVRQYGQQISGRVAKVALESIITEFGRKNRQGSKSAYGSYLWG